MRPRSTGVGFYNSEYRNSNRGFGQSNYKSFQNSRRQPSPLPTRKGDLFIEAGRLAVEYLVSRGLLSSNVLSGKHQNGTLRNHSEESKDHRLSQDREYSPVNSRSLAVTKQGASPDRDSGSRKSPNNDDPRMSRKSSMERGKFATSRSYSSDWSRENGREDSLLDKVSGFHNKEENVNDKNPKDTSKAADNDAHLSHSVESASKDDVDSKLLDEKKKSHSDVDSDLKMNTMPQTKDEKEPLKCSDVEGTGCEERKDEINDVDIEKESSRDELAGQQSEENTDTSGNDGVDLLKLCHAAKIPTKLRSSLTNKNLKSDVLLVREEQSTSDIRIDSLDSTSNIAANGSTETMSPIVSIDTTQQEHSFQDGVHQQKPSDSRSLTENTPSYENKIGERPELGTCSFIAETRGSKRAFVDEDIAEGAKKSKQWLSVAQSDEYSQLADLSENQSILPANRDANTHIYNSADQRNFTDVSLPLKGGVESVVDQEEEKQPLFSSSFKICDLNLNMHGSHDVPTLLYPSISASNKDTSVDVDLSMNNNCSLNNGYNDCGSARKDIEIIDLESGSLQEGENMPPRSMEADITSMETFPSNPQSSIANPDGQDGYGFMISELLGNDDPNCSSVQPDINSLHNDMNLHHGEGMFSEDDPIYMSLGEIPISLMRVWEQPAPERNPFGL